MIPIRWLLIAWTFVISAIAYLDRVNLSIAGKAIQTEYGFSDAELGRIFSAFALGYALFQAPAGNVADRIGPRLTLLLGVIWWGVFTTLSAAIPASAASALLLMIVLRFMLGVGEAVVYPSSNRMVAEWLPFRERGRANGIIFAGVGAGAGVTPPLIIYIMQNYGWRTSFIVSALIGIIAGVVWYLIARNKPSQHPWVTEGERRVIAEGIPSVNKPSEKVGVPWGAVARSRDLLAMSLSYFAYGYVAYIFFTWFFIYLNSVRHLDLKASRFYAMLPFIAMAICSSLGGWISDKWVKARGAREGRCGIAVIGMALAAVFVTAATQVESARLASVILAGGAGALYLAQSSFWAVTSEIAGRSAGTVSGIMNMGGQLGAFVTGMLTPYIAKDYGWTASFVTAAALCFIGAILWLFVNPGSRLYAEDMAGTTASVKA